MVFHVAERRQTILHKTVLINLGEIREETQLLFCFSSNAWDVRSHKPFLDRYLMQADGSTADTSHRLSSTLHPLSQMAVTRPDPEREMESQTHCHWTKAVRWQLPPATGYWSSTEAGAVGNCTSPYLQDREGAQTCPTLEEGQGIQHMKLPPGRKACNYHLSVKLLQFVCLLTGTLNSLESIFNTIQPVFTVGLLKGNNVTARTRQRLTVHTVVFVQQHSPTWTHLFKQP